MARVTTEEITGWKVCAAPRYFDSDMWPDEIVRRNCAGRKPQQIPLVKETVAFSFADNGAPPDTFGMDVHATERSTTHIKPADGRYECDECGGPANFSEQKPPRYTSRSGQDPDTLLNIEEEKRREADNAERQAVALERLVEQGEAASEVAALRAELAELRAAIAAGNVTDHDSGDDAPSERSARETSRPRPKAKA